MRFLVAKGMSKVAAQDLLTDYRVACKNARQAILDKDIVNFRIYAGQVRSFIEMEFQDPDGNVGRIVTYLTLDEKTNPYGLTMKEQLEISIWASKRDWKLASGKLH